MAKREALGQYFDHPMQDGSPLEALTALRRKKVPADDVEDVTEFFGELHFKENPSDSTENDDDGSPQILPLEVPATRVDEGAIKDKNSSPPDSDSCGPSESKTESRSVLKNPKNLQLQLCTEGLGSESCVYEESVQTLESVEDKQSRHVINRHRMSKWGKSNVEGFPPPIRTIGRNGQRLVSFRSYWEDGRHVLKELRVPEQEFLQASREDGRLKLRLIQRDADIEPEEDQNDDEDQESGNQADDGGDDCNETEGKET